MTIQREKMQSMKHGRRDTKFSCSHQMARTQYFHVFSNVEALQILYFGDFSGGFITQSYFIINSTSSLSPFLENIFFPLFLQDHLAVHTLSALRVSGELSSAPWFILCPRPGPHTTSFPELPIKSQNRRANPPPALPPSWLLNPRSFAISFALPPACLPTQNTKQVWALLVGLD